ncbi:MAG: SRPBCC domain-containing protein [Acidobacteria bacterium]|nr:MAG: SRPBCC domain-containing protein [Acidobacteriota bacterium]
MTLTAPTLDNLTLNLTHEIHVRASLDATFDALLEQMGPANETPDGTPLPMTIEARPGGRWFRDLGHDDGHFWGSVQAIKRPTLLEITGPLFMSAPIVSNVQYRLKEVDGGTLITFRHSALGFVPDDVREGLSRGWTPLLERVRRRAEAIKNAR